MQQQHNNQSVGTRKNKQSTVRAGTWTRRRMKRRSQSSPLRPSTDSLTMGWRQQEGGRRRQLLRQEPPLCELRTRQRFLQPCEGRRQWEMENDIPAGSRGQKARRPVRRSRPQVAAPHCGRLPRKINNQPPGAQLYYNQQSTCPVCWGSAEEEKDKIILLLFIP